VSTILSPPWKQIRSEKLKEIVVKVWLSRLRLRDGGQMTVLKELRDRYRIK